MAIQLCSWVVVVLLVMLIHSRLGLCSRVNVALSLDELLLRVDVC